MVTNELIAILAPVAIAFADAFSVFFDFWRSHSSAVVRRLPTLKLWRKCRCAPSPPPFFGTVPPKQQGWPRRGNVYPRPLSAPLSRLRLARAPARGPSSAEQGWKSVSGGKESDVSHLPPLQPDCSACIYELPSGPSSPDSQADEPRTRRNPSQPPSGRAPSAATQPGRAPATGCPACAHLSAAPPPRVARDARLLGGFALCRPSSLTETPRCSDPPSFLASSYRAVQPSAARVPPIRRSRLSCSAGFGDLPI